MNLEGKRILIVQDKHDLARDLRVQFESLGAVVLGPAPTPFYASFLLGRRPPDGAVLDIRLHGQPVHDLAAQLTSMGVPILFATGVEPAQMAPRYTDAAVLQRPYTPAQAADRLASLIAEKNTPARFIPTAKRGAGGGVEARLLRAAARALLPSRESSIG